MMSRNLRVLIACVCLLCSHRSAPADELSTEAVAGEKANPPHWQSAAVETWTALRQPIAIDSEGLSFEEAVHRVADMVGVTIDIDEESLQAEGVGLRQPSSFTVEGVTAKSVLNLLMEPHRLEMSVKIDGRVVIDSPRSSSRLQVRTYTIHDLLEISQPPGDDSLEKTEMLEQLRKLIVFSIRPESWDEFGGVGAIQTDEAATSLVVRQSPAVHAEISSLLEDIREMQFASIPDPAALTDTAVRRKLVETISDTRVTVSHTDAPLTDVVADLVKATQLNFVIDARGISEEGVTTETPVSLVVENRRLSTALDELLHPLNLDYVVENQVVMVTSRQQAMGDLKVLVYDVGHIVNRTCDPSTDRSTLEELAAEIEEKIAPNDWRQNGGSGSISVHESTNSLVVRQFSPNHTQIDTYLNSLRTE